MVENVISLLFSESIYENAAVLKSTNFIKPISSTLEKYEFGQNENLKSDSLGDESNESVVFPSPRQRSGRTYTGCAEGRSLLELIRFIKSFSNLRFYNKIEIFLKEFV